MYLKKSIGKNVYTFVAEGKNLYEMVTESQKLSFNDVDKCGCCGSDNLFLNARKAQEKFKYVEIKCAKCKGSLVFGQTQENPDVFYLRKNEDKSYKWTAYDPNSTAPTA